MFRSLLSSLYSAFVARRNSKFDAGKGVHLVDVPVISVGNVSVGGTGKSPFVILLANTLLRMGYSPAIVSRGYGRRSRGIVLVSNGKQIQSSVETAGDELTMIAHALPHCVVVAAEQRFLGATRVLREFPDVDIIILDDGFQHRALARDVDIVLVDRPTLDAPTVVPAGVLREPLANLKRASLVVCTPGVHAHEVQSFTSAPVIFARTEFRGCTRLQSEHSTADSENNTADSKDSPAGSMDSPADSMYSPADVSVPTPRRAVLVTAIANAHRVLQSCKDLGVEIAHHAEFRDHYFYTAKDVESINALCKQHQCSVVLTTAKDAPKLRQWLREFNDNDIQLLVLRIETVCEPPEMPEEFLKNVLRDFSSRGISTR